KDFSSRRAPRKKTALHVGSGEEAAEREDERPVAHPQPGYGWTRADSGDSPADPEERSPAKRSRIELGRMLVERFARPGFRHDARNQVIGDEGHHHRAAQHEQQSHVAPQQEIQHDLGPHHGGEREPETEERARSKDEGKGAAAHANAATTRAV